MKLNVPVKNEGSVLVVEFPPENNAMKIRLRISDKGAINRMIARP
jgi:hypothetical protein